MSGSRSYDRLVDALQQHGSKVLDRGTTATAQCPAHDDRAPSLSVTSIEGSVLIYCHAGCATDDVLAALGLERRDLYDDPKGATYRYPDGRIVHRTPSKDFWQSGSTKGRPVIYRDDRIADAVKDGHTIFVVEGEKDVHAVEAAGGVATCAPMGAGKWSKVDASSLYGGRITVVADRDDAGLAHARQVFDSLDGCVESIEVVVAREGKDAADHIAAGLRLDDFDPIELVAEYHDPDAVEDAHIAQTVAERALRNRFCWTAGLGWMAYRRGTWVRTTDATVCETVRQDLITQHGSEAKAGASVDRLKRLSSLLSAARIRSIVSLARGILEVDDSDFDQYPDLLNVANGVVDLRTGELRAHDPGLYLTKVSPVAYREEASSTDWTDALAALPANVVEWLQLRIGQAATGYPVPDDLLCVLQGGGSNGKTTITGAILRALGDHAVPVPERLLLANPNDHPTELMTLRGARLAMIEETPEARHLSVKRLKDTVGTPMMTARLIRRDNVTWQATHSLFLTTNYVPRIDETDHGTWRRLALVRFPYRFVTANDVAAGRTGTDHVRPGIPGLRERLRDGRQGQHEAVLAWVVEGARRWFELSPKTPPLPESVVRDTKAWRGEADLIFAYVTDRLIADPDAHVMSTELFQDFTGWLGGRGHKGWADQTFAARLLEHEVLVSAQVEKRQIRSRSSLSRPAFVQPPPPAVYTAWLGLRFRRSDESATWGQTRADLGKPP